jgi:hypothetical protein
MATRLQPLLQFCVEEKNEPAGSLFNDESRTSEMRVGTRTKECIVVASRKLCHSLRKRELRRVVGLVLIQLLGEGQKIV